MNEVDTVKTSLIREAAMFLARIYKQHIYPLRYERVFYLDTIRIKLTIEEYKSVDDTQPLRRLTDEDDKIAD